MAGGLDLVVCRSCYWTQVGNLNKLEMIEILCRKIMHFTELIAIWTILNCLVSSPSRALSLKLERYINKRGKKIYIPRKKRVSFRSTFNEKTPYVSLIDIECIPLRSNSFQTLLSFRKTYCNEFSPSEADL